MMKRSWSPSTRFPTGRPVPRGALLLLLVLAVMGSVLPACTNPRDEGGRAGGGEAGSREGATVVAEEAGEAGGAGGASVGVPLETPVPKPEFTLTDVSDGEPFHFAEETEGFVTLIFVGYTHCPDVCPVHMANLAAVLPELPRRVSEQIRVVFVSSDPERDTPERIRTWLDSFDPSFIGLRGSQEEVRGVEEALGLPPSVVEEEGAREDYFVGHSAQVLAFEMDDTARVGFPWGTRQRDWRRALPRLVPDGGG